VQPWLRLLFNVRTKEHEMNDYIKKEELIEKVKEMLDSELIWLSDFTKSKKFDQIDYQSGILQGLRKVLIILERK